MMTAIILVNWNGADDTIACLESLSRMTEPHFVVIADNSSSDDSVSRIQAWIDEFGQDRHPLQKAQPENHTHGPGYMRHDAGGEPPLRPQ